MIYNYLDHQHWSLILKNFPFLKIKKKKRKSCKLQRGIMKVSLNLMKDSQTKNGKKSNQIPLSQTEKNQTQNKWYENSEHWSNLIFSLSFFPLSPYLWRENFFLRSPPAGDLPSSTQIGS